jgi:hypothetical protein
MSTDFRALCAELVDELEDWIYCDDESEITDTHSLINRARAALDAQPEPVAPVWADIHYAWKLLDAEGDWLAGGSANSLDDVRQEACYLQTCWQDVPHKLIIQRHCVNTIEEVTNG